MKLPAPGSPEDRAEYEAWCRRGFTPMDKDWLIRAQSGRYVISGANAGWAAWQARGHASLMEIERVEGNAKHAAPAKLLRDVQLLAADGLALSVDGSEAHAKFAAIHRMVCLAMMLKAATPPGDQDKSGRQLL